MAYTPPEPFEVIYELGDLEMVEKTPSAERALDLAENLQDSGKNPTVRDPDGRLYTPGQLRARPPEPPPGPSPEEFLLAARRRGG